MQADTTPVDTTPVDIIPADTTPADAASADLHLSVGLAVGLSATTLLAACGAGAIGDGDAATWPEHGRDRARAQEAPQLLRRRPLALQAGAGRLPDAQALFDWAERSYPAFFPTHEANRQFEQFTYRVYPSTGNHLGLAGSDVYVLGPVSGGQLLRVGSLADFAPLVYPRAVPGSRAQAARFVLQAQVGATDDDIDAVMALGFEGWLQAQMAQPMADRAWDWLESRGYGVVNAQAYYDGGGPFFDLAAYRQVITAPDGLRRRLQLMLTEYFVVSLGSVSPPWPHFAYATFWDGLGDHAFGNFRALLEFVTLSASMGAFLNTAGNQKEDPATGRVPDENYAREVMQLFTIGLHQLHPDGTPVLDAQGRPVEAYGARDVTELARVFTGYQIDDSGPRITPLVGGGWRPAHPYSRRPMRFVDSLHDTRAVTFLGTTIPAGTPGPQALKIALDTLFQHPNVGPFFGRQLIQRLVTSNPSPAYVARVAAAFADNGQGVRGDLQQVIAAVLLDDEARGDTSLASPQFGRLREPALRFLQWARSFRLTSKAGSWKWTFDVESPELFHGQRLFWAPSVFNFFRPGHVPPGTPMAERGATAPEFQIVNESTVAQYINLLEQYLLNGVWVHAPDRPEFDFGTPSAASGFDLVPDYSREEALATDSRALVDRLNLLMCAGQLSAHTCARVAAALDTQPPRAGNPQDLKAHVARALLLVMVCPEYLVQK